MMLYARSACAPGQMSCFVRRSPQQGGERSSSVKMTGDRSPRPARRRRSPAQGIGRFSKLSFQDFV
jgi:hypothetical protein